MKVHLYFNHARFGYEIFFYGERPGYRIPYRMENGYLTWSQNDAVQDGEEMPVTMFLDGNAYNALREAMVGDVIASDDALRDTRAIRDRLLKLVEDEWAAKVKDGFSS